MEIERFLLQPLLKGKININLINKKYLNNIFYLLKKFQLSGHFLKSTTFNNDKETLKSNIEKLHHNYQSRSLVFRYKLNLISKEFKKIILIMLLRRELLSRCSFQITMKENIEILIF